MADRYAASGIPFLRSQNVRPFALDLTDVVYIDPAFHAELAKSALKAGDVVIVRTGTPGVAAVIPESLGPANCSDLVIVRPGPHLDSRFLSYCINVIARDHVSAHLVGAVQQHFNVGSARVTRLPIPNLEEQRAIVAVVGALDDKIAMNRRMNHTLEATASALFQSWFVDFAPVAAKVEGRRSVGVSEAVHQLMPSSFADSMEDMVPSGWDFGELGDIADVVDCLHSKKPARQATGCPLLQLDNIRGDGLLDMSETYFISPEDYERWTSRFEAQEGDCVITNVGRVGAAAQVPIGVRAALGRNMTGIRCTASSPYPTFLIELLLSAAMREEIERKTDSGTILDALNVRSIPRLRFVLPPAEVRTEFEQIARPLRARMEANLRESATLMSLRDALLPQLLSGTIRLRQAEHAVAAAI